MPKQYAGLGIQVMYPDTWRTDENPEDGSVTIESPSGGFMAINQLDDEADAKQALEQAKLAMEEEYDEVELEPLELSAGGQQLAGITQRFVYLDLIVTSHLLVFESDNSARFLIQMQAEDRDMNEAFPVFHAMLTSLAQSLAEE